MDFIHGQYRSVEGYWMLFWTVKCCLMITDGKPPSRKCKTDMQERMDDC